MTLEYVRTHRRMLLGLALLFMTVAAYLPAMHSGGFIWDDEAYVIHNRTLRDGGGLVDIWTNPRATPQYYPLVHTTYWLEYRLWELDPTGYHVTNVLLHALAVILLWRVLRYLKVPGAWLAAAFFAVHPVHVESVAWITERKNVLSGVFYLGAALAYLKWDEAGIRREARLPGYLLALLLYVCALLSKTVTSTLPAALVLIVWWKGGFANGASSPGPACPAPCGEAALVHGSRSEGRRWRPAERGASRDLATPEAWGAALLALLPFFVVGLAMSALTVWLEVHHVGAEGVEWHLSFIDRCLIAGRALWFYVGKLFWPATLCFNYPRWEIDAGVWWQYLYPLSAAVVMVLLWFSRKRVGRGPLVAVLFFAGTLVPALGFFDVYPMRYSFVADHFQYHASMGLLALAAVILTRGWQRIRGRRSAQRDASPYLRSRTNSIREVGRNLPPSRRDDGRVSRPATALAGAILLLLGVLAWKQCHIYQGLEPLWQDTIKKNPASWKAYTNLGMLYLNQGRPADAIPLFQKTLQLNPKEMIAYSNLGAALVRIGRIDAAMQTYHRALEMDPDDPLAYNSLGAAWATQMRYDKAIPYYQKALAIEPDLTAAHINLGEGLARLGRSGEAIEHHKKSIELAPDYATVYLKYGQTLQGMGRTREAQEQYRTAVSLDPALAAAHINLGLIAVSDQLLESALHHFRRAVEEKPDVPDAQRNLAKTLAALGRTAEAQTHFDIAVELDSRSVKTRKAYGDFLLKHGDKAGARREYIAVAALKPGTPALLFQIGLLDQQLGDTADAEKRFRAVLDADANHAPAHNLLAVLLAGKGKNEQAMALLRRAVKLEPGDAEFHNNLGVILMRSGKQKEALASLEEAVRLNPDYGEARKNLDDLRKLTKDGGNP